MIKLDPGGNLEKSVQVLGVRPPSTLDQSTGDAANLYALALLRTVEFSLLKSVSNSSGNGQAESRAITSEPSGTSILDEIGRK